jgi:hypothetical protein
MTPTVFTWGYEGWGNATRELDRAFRAVEAARGFAPPVFVDVRARRQVRAIGFRDDVFQQRVVGRERYRWLRGLGNEQVRTGRGPMRLRRRGDVAELLGIVLAAARQGRRVLFFCSCQSPERCGTCHRQLVRNALLREARRIDQPLRIQEWPGGTLSSRVRTEVRVAAEVLTQVRRGRKTVPLGKGLPPVELLSLPHYSLVRLRSREDVQLVSVLPARAGARGWHLPIGLFPVHPADTSTLLGEAARRIRRRDRLEGSDA